MNLAEKILIVDDDIDDYFIASDALVENGFEEQSIIWAKNGQELSNYLKRHRASLILLDINMPEKNGFEVLAEIRSNSKLYKTPVVMVSTSKAESDISRCFELGANWYISKNNSYQEFTRLLKGVCKHLLDPDHNKGMISSW